MTFLSVCYTNIRTNSTYYVQHTTDWTELNVLLYDGTHVLTGLLLLCVWWRLTTFNKRIWWWRWTLVRKKTRHHQNTDYRPTFIILFRRLTLQNRQATEWRVKIPAPHLKRVATLTMHRICLIILGAKLRTNNDATRGIRNSIVLLVLIEISTDFPR